jgi:adenylosuccinate synthase
MPATILIGAQWGDEGKGRVVDWLAANETDIVARYGGGDNAGHTVVVGKDVFKLHLVPSGILREGVTSVLGNGMVINPVRLVEEIDQLTALGVTISPERLLISTRAHIISPAHIALDAAAEKARGEEAVGTTLRGIGPAYLDKAARQGIRAGQMVDLESFADVLHDAIQRANEALARQGSTVIDPKDSTARYVEAAARLKPFLYETAMYLNQRLKDGARVLCEGAQGTLLDVDHGSYPFVTSSSPSVGGALTGLGFGPKYVDRVFGVAKSFSTRVGGGPMPTELTGELGDRLRGTGENFWDEYGTTTGRPRRCGWLDLVMLRYSAQINGLSELMLTKLDVLSGLDELKIAVAYDIDGERHDFPPSTIGELERAKPVYDTLPGWREDVSQCRKGKDMPDNARSYIQCVAELCDTSIKFVSVGPERDQLVRL